MNPLDWLPLVPEAARRRLWAQALDAGAPLVAVSAPLPVGRPPLLPGARWSAVQGERVLALYLAPLESLAASLAGAELRPLAPLELCFFVGEAGGEGLEPFVAQARALVGARDGLGLWRAAQARLEALPPGSRSASVLRWLLAALARPRPERALVVALLDGLTDAWVPPLPDEAPAERARTPEGPSAEQALALLEGQLAMLSVPCDAAVVEGRLLAVRTVLSRVLRRLGQEGFVTPAEEAVRAGLAERSAEPVRRFLAEVLGLWRAGPAPESKAGPAADDAPEQEAPAKEAAEGQKKESVKLLKVEPERIEALMRLVGELVVAKNALPFLARKAEEGLDAKTLGRAIREQYGVVNRISEELQAAVLRVRMVPVSTVFRRLPRLVRDLSGALQKKVRFELEGEDTEADKDVVQDLFDPLMHLTRNSLDHGLEGPEERTRAGKPAEGTIRLSAVQHEDQVVIELSDDGRGIDPERLKRKAVDKGFLTAEAAAKLTAEEALQLIFLAGFSTAEQVTDVSGRGVGMDVVNSMVASVGGRITLHSKLGKGTTTTITLPLTMAVSHVMVVEAGGIAFGIPFSSMVETVRVAASQLQPLQGGEALVLRDRLVPVCRLARALGLVSNGRRDGTEALLVARVGGALVAFVIDEFQQAVDVIAKPLEGVLKGLRRYSGTALLGDGRLLLILDLEALVDGLGDPVEAPAPLLH